MEGANDRLPLTNVLASPLPDETDLDVEGEVYFDGFPRQDDFVADGKAVMSGYNIRDSADGADAEGVYTGFKENFTDKESCKGSTRKGIPGLASADPDNSGTLPTCARASSNDGRCSRWPAPMSAGPSSGRELVGGRAPQGVLARASAVTRKSASEKRRGSASVRGVKRSGMVWRCSGPQAAAGMAVSLPCSSRERPTGSSSTVLGMASTGCSGVVPAPRGSSRVWRSRHVKSSRISLLAPPAADVPRDDAVAGPCGPCVPARPVELRLHYSSVVRLLGPTGSAEIRNPPFGQVPRCEAEGGGGGDRRSRVPPYTSAWSVGSANGGGGT